MNGCHAIPPCTDECCAFLACVGSVCSDSVGKQHVRKGPGRGARRVTFADVAGIDAAKLELSTSDSHYIYIYRGPFQGMSR